MVSTLHYRRMSPRRLLTLLRTVGLALAALPSPGETEMEVGSSLLREEFGQVPVASLKREAEALLALVDARAAEGEDKANLVGSWGEGGRSKGGQVEILMSVSVHLFCIGHTRRR